MRNYHIDVAKGIGIILVIAGHLFTYKSVISMMIFSFHMPVFFFLSGMLYRKNEYSVFLFLKEKFKKLWYPFFLVMLLGFLISLLLPSWRESLTLNSILSDLYKAQPEKFHVGQIWFLACLFHVEFIYHVMYWKLLRKISCASVIIIFIIIAVMGKEVVNVNSFFPYHRLPIKIDSAIMGMFFYGIGHYYMQFMYTQKLFNDKCVFALLGLICSPLNGWSNLADVSYNSFILYFLFSLSGIFFVLWLARKLQHVKFLQFIGKNSLEIFTMHSFLISLWCEGLSNLLEYNIVNGKNMPPLYSVIGTIIILFVFCFEISIRNNIVFKGHNEKRL